MLSLAGASVFTGYWIIQKVRLNLFEIDTLYQRFRAGILQETAALGISSKYTHFNPIKTKSRLLYLKPQTVPRNKQFPSRL